MADAAPNRQGEKRILVGKIASWAIILVVGLGLALLVVVLAGRHSFPLWSFIAALILFSIASYWMTRAVGRTPRRFGYLLDAGYGIIAGLSFLVFQYAYESIRWPSFLLVVWMLVTSMGCTAYIDKRHPAAQSAPEA
ncbi:hypothetical protein DDD64_04205 [Actinotignum sanguinis]|uniref:hypothetical protein n=1 Tax=Actinotignum sanguinis TaxID=1445614 RepID=UPI000F7E2DCA|nr:hypothetical protein [Actinotignum sanguinis]MDY5147999.1 hypothetical protein [Actinotignum sanguinis]RTE50035.1 hypothetical protein DDD64_04205 [Actinotignum sanguinis]